MAPRWAKPGTVVVYVQNEDTDSLVTMEYAPERDLGAFLGTMGSLANHLEPSATYTWWSEVVPEPELEEELV